MHDIGAGRIVGERYLLQERRAHLGDLEVWLAADKILKHPVSLSVFPARSRNAEAILDAARRCSVLSDARLVRVFDVGRTATMCWFVEEALEGSHTMATLLREGPLPAEEVRRIVGEVTQALQVASQRGLHHQHLSPHAVRRTRDGRIKLAGIAIAAAIQGGEGLSSTEASRLDARNALALAYAGLTTKWPLPQDVPSGFEPAPRLVGGVAAPSEIAAGVPADLDALCRAAFNNGGGPRTPQELAQQLAPWPKEQVGRVQAIPATRPEPPRVPASKPRKTPGHTSSFAKAAPSGITTSAQADSTPGIAETASLEDTAALPVVPVSKSKNPTLPTPAGPGFVEGAPSAHPGSERDETSKRPETAGLATSVAAPTMSTPPAAVPVSAETADPTRPTPTAVANPATDSAVATPPPSSRESQEVESSVAERRSSRWSRLGQEASFVGLVPRVFRKDRPQSGDLAAATSVSSTATSADSSLSPAPLHPTERSGRKLQETIRPAVGSMTGALEAFIKEALGRIGAVRAGWRRRADNEPRRNPPLDGGLIALANSRGKSDRLGGGGDERDGAHSRFVLAVVAGVVVLALILALPSLFQSAAPSITGSDGAVPPPAPASPAVTSAPGPASSTSSSSGIETGRPVSITSASGFDPQGDGQEKNGQAAQVFDGDPNSSWTSEGYLSGPAFSGKQGVGVILTVPRDSRISNVTLRLSEAPQDVTVYAANQRSLNGATQLGTLTNATREQSVTAGSQSPPSQYVIIWFTKAAPDGSKYRCTLSEVTLRS